MPESDPEGRYQFVGELGRGGMGAVLKGRDTEIGRDLAIKVLLERFSNDQELLDRFIDEAQIGGQLQHPGIAPVYEMGKFEDNRPYFTMKLIKGSTLAEILAERDSPRDDWPKLLPIFEQVCQTIAYAHSKGVIHRDLKPSNIMVGAFGEVQVMDWGLAKVLDVGGDADEKMQNKKDEDATFIQTRRSSGDSDSGGSGSATRAGSGMGTPAYMPPEQALGEIDSLDERADVFGLGAILAEILTGKPAYVGEDLVMQARRGRIKECLKRIDASGADEALVGMAKKALEPESKDRQRHAGVLTDQVTRYLEGVQEKLRKSEIEAARSRVRFRFLISLLALFALCSVLFVMLMWQVDAYKQQELLAQRNEADAKLNMKLLQASVTKEVPARFSMLLDAATTKGISETSLKRAHSTLLDETHGCFGRMLGDGSGIPPVIYDENGLYLPGQRVFDVEFSPDSRWLAAGNRMWNMESTDPAKSMRQLHNQDVSRVAFSPDSRWVVNQTSAGVKAFNLRAEFEELELEIFGSNICFSPSGQWLSCTEEDRIVLYDWAISGPTGEQHILKGKLRKGKTEIGPLGRWIAHRSGTDEILLWRVGEELEQEPTCQLPDQGDDFYWSMAFDPKGRWFATSSKDNEELSLWDLTAADIPASKKSIPFPGVVKVGFIEEPNQLYCLSAAGIYLWDLSGGLNSKSSRRIPDNGTSSDGFLYAQLLQDRWIVNGTSMWDTSPQAGKQVKTELPDEGWGPAFAYSANGKWRARGNWNHCYPWVSRIDSKQLVISPHVLRGGSRARFLSESSTPGNRQLCLFGQRSAKVAIFDLEAELYRPMELAFREAIDTGYLTRNGKWFITGDARGSVRVFDIVERKLHKIELDGQSQSIDRYCISEDGRRIATATSERKLQLWQVAPEDFALPAKVMGEAQEFAIPGGRKPMLAFTPDKRWVYVTAEGGSTQLLRVTEDGIQEPKLIQESYGSLSPFCSDSLGKWAVTRRGPKTWLWNLQVDDPTQNPVFLPGGIEGNFTWAGVAFSDNGRLLAVGDWHPQVQIWDLKNIGGSTQPSPKIVIRKIPGSAYSLDFDSAGQILAVGSPNIISTFDLKAGEAKPLLNMRGHDGAPYSVAFDPTGQYLVSAGPKEAHVWNLDFDSAIQDALQARGPFEMPDFHSED